MDVSWDSSSYKPQLNFRVPATLTDQLRNSQSCCTSLAGLSYQPITRQGSFEVRIGTDSPSFNFGTGKSYFAAFRLPNWPRPLTIGVDSFRAAEPGGLGALIPDLRGLIFRPVVLILDEQFRVTQMVDNFSPGTDCRNNAFSPALRTEFDIDMARAQSTYMIVLTTDAFREKKEGPICGVMLNGFSPIGKLKITSSSLGYFGDGQIAYKAPFVWHQNAHGSDNVGIFSRLFKSPATLLVTGDGLHLVEWASDGYKELFSVPNERIVSVNTDAIGKEIDKKLLVIGITERSTDEIAFHTFFAEGEASPAKVETLLASRLKTAWFTEKVGILAANTPPMVNIREVVLPSAATKRVKDSALAGGIVVALPCGLCQTGLCSPEVLVPCAALFAVGATVGGIVGIGSEIVHGAPAEKPKPDSDEVTASATRSNTEAAFASRAGGMHFRQCLTKQFLHLDRTTPWISQGRRGFVHSIISENAAAGENLPYASWQRDGYRFVAESLIESVNLLAEGEPGQSLVDMQVRLEVKGHIRFIDLTRQIHRDIPLRWQSVQRTWANWNENKAKVLETTLDQACDELAKQVIAETEATWKSW